jgi:predicted XRE-type DNA-binding protein
MIICIYFLGHSLDYTDAGVIGVNRNYTDLITGKPIKEKESFIESLTHDSYVIQIPKLSQKRRTDLEILLSVFDQSNSVDASSHILNIEETDYPPKYHPIIRCLQKAVLDPDVKNTMDLEDGIIDELEDMQRDIDELREGKAKERQRADAEMQRANAEKEKLDSAILKAIKRGKLSIEEIAEDFGVSSSYVNSLLR